MNERDTVRLLYATGAIGRKEAEERLDADERAYSERKRREQIARALEARKELQQRFW